MEEKEMDVLGVAKTNINWLDGRRKEANMALKMRFGQGKMVASSSKANR